MSVYETMIIATDKNGNHFTDEFEVKSDAREFSVFIAHEFANYSILVNQGELQCYTVLCFESEATGS